MSALPGLPRSEVLSHLPPKPKWLTRNIHSLPIKYNYPLIWRSLLFLYNYRIFNK